MKIVGVTGFRGFLGFKVGVANSIGIDENNTFQLKFLF